MSLDLRLIVGGGLAAVAAAWLIYAGANKMYFAPRKTRLAEIAELRDRVDRCETAIDSSYDMDNAIAGYADRTLGADQETVDHRLRTRLNRIAEEVGLEGKVVSTGGTSARPSPGRRQFRGASRRELRDEIDFVELDGSITGQGSLEQVVSLVDRIDAEPWLKRIDQLRVEPKNNGERFAVTVRLTTLYLPGLEPSGEAKTEWNEKRLARFAPLLAANPFRVPPPPEPIVVRAEDPTPPPAPPPPPPPAFPWAEWTLSGVAEGPAGNEAWLRNRASGETRRLGVGQDLNHAELARIAVDWAEFRLDAERFRVQVGQTLNDRTPVND